MLKQTVLILGLILGLGVHAAEQSTEQTEVLEYVTRTAKDYCSPTNIDCINTFSLQMMASYKDGEKDSKSRFKNDTLIRRYENRLMTLECIPAQANYKDLCTSMVDRLVDAYNRGLSKR
ncbi:valyl-tRNA synthetase modifier [Serratia phage X20]|uniref:Valyl-tRNA synthetase modifier n=3 Tax=Winklervirus TaxID=2560256 RepID=A0A1Z1LZ40_9CAUD|nr:valyl tRNA synthetase modifier [Serratia phage CHI14]YP_010092266.1 valyl tRNA synthetase modifier [Serratia phage X20]ARW57540.1 valyl-tRNA synthetase modifier [Serratia phage CHI14]ARW57815.1 valyl-tRNA synthetase modifier [Serratia phage CBH8]ARW58088.1 valyl-tRNA synthetase modifier [Serratia phage X20]